MGDRMTFNNSPGVGFLGILRQSRRVSSLEKKGDTDRVPGGWKKKKKEYLSGLTFALNSLLLKLIIFTEINSNYLSFYGLQVCSAKNPIMHLSVSVKEVSVCDCFHIKAVISN